MEYIGGIGGIRGVMIGHVQDSKVSRRLGEAGHPISLNGANPQRPRDEKVEREADEFLLKPEI